MRRTAEYSIYICLTHDSRGISSNRTILSHTRDAVREEEEAGKKVIHGAMMLSMRGSDAKCLHHVHGTTSSSTSSCLSKLKLISTLHSTILRRRSGTQHARYDAMPAATARTDGLDGLSRRTLPSNFPPSCVRCYVALGKLRCHVHDPRQVLD